MRKLFAASLVFGGFLACGGGSSTPPVTPTPATSSASASSEPSASVSASASASAAPKVTIAFGAMKFTPAKGKKNIEVKADGSVMSSEGKSVGKINGDHLEDSAGKAVLTLGADDTLSAEGLTGTWKFEGDELVGPEGKITIADDGTVTASGKKKETLGKWENLGGNKRAAALIIAAMLIGKPAPAPGPTSASAAVPSASVKPPKK